MKKIDRFVIKSFIGPLVLTFFIVLIILLLQFLWMYVDELAGKGLDIKILGELLFQFSLSFVPTALPLAILLASLMTFGNMGEFSELTALKSSGIPLQRIMRPLIILISFLVIVSFLFSNYVLPYSNRQARSLLYDIRRKRPDINLQAGTFNNDIEGYSIKITSKDPFTNRLDKLIIYDHTKRKGNVSVTFADSGYIRVTPDESAMIMVLYNGFSFNEIEEKNVSAAERKYPSRKDMFKEQTVVLSLSGFDLERSGNELFRSNSWSKNMEELSHDIDSLTKTYDEKQRFQYLEFSRTKLYTERNYSPSSPAEGSSGISSGDPVKFDTKTLFDTLDVYDKREVLSRAIENLKDANSFLLMKNESMKMQIRYIKRYTVDWHKKLTLPFACLVFFFIGAPLGAIIRKGGLGTPAVISIFFFVIWYVISLSGEKLVEENLISSIAGMWASSYILLPVGIFLTYKASTDSVIMNIDTYLMFFRKIKNYVYRIIFQGKMKNPDNKSEQNE
ncbi:MAG: LptF/LptG family permease [Bacteroidales bacterium]|nr:LptF/LptG family permease [Bacteroidales bacterium]